MTAPATEVTAPSAAPAAAQKTKSRPPGVLKRLAPHELTEEQEAKRQQMLALARELGYVCQSRKGLEMDLAQQIYARMTNREGKAIFQVIDFSISFPREAALQILPDSLRMESTASTMLWQSSTLEEAQTMIGELLSSVSNNASGLTRAVNPPSESQIRVWATLMPTIWAKHTTLEHGAERLNIKASFVLWDNSADYHAPKSSNRLDIEIGAELEAQLRQKVLQDVFQISENGATLSASWWRQIGREDQAVEVEAGRVTQWQRQRAALAAQRAAERAATRLALQPPQYDVERILEEQPTTGAARCYYLVEWSGYDPSWEAWRIMGDPGTAVLTWEREAFVRRTVAFQEWKAQQQQTRTADSSNALPQQLL